MHIHVVYCTYVYNFITCTIIAGNCYFSMSSSLPSEAAFPTRRVSTPAMPSNFPQSPDHHSTQVVQKKYSVAGPPLSPLHSPSATMNFNTGAQLLCKPFRHAPDAEIVDSFNNVELNNSHERISVPSIMNEAVPPPKPPRRASANPRMMDFSNDVVNGSRSNTASPELGGPIEEPPPIPIKKKNRKTLGLVLSITIMWA